jgi:ubiquinone/menaquinone biosynthesis C-methylase UbiE
MTMVNQPIGQRVAELYDAYVPDWPGEIEFYRKLAAEVRSNGGALLEIACGTGRVAVRLAQDGVRVVGIDLSTAMLEQARQKSVGIPHVRWVEADMRSFDLGEMFELIIIPGHAFQNILTPADQMACLQCIQRHLVPHGTLVVHLDHQDIAWLGELRTSRGGVFETAKQFTHPKTKRLVRTARAWSYAPSTQTASAVTVYEEIGADGEVIDRWETGPTQFHCVFRFEMEHLLSRMGFDVEAVYGDFFWGQLRDESTEMVWLARNPPPTG